MNGRPVDPTLVYPTESEQQFSLAHELAHVSLDDQLVMAGAAPAAVATAGYLAGSPFLHRFVLRLSRGRMSPALCAMAPLCLSLLVVQTAVVALTRTQESRADATAAGLGYGQGGVDEMRRALRLNQEVKSVTGSSLITRDGDYVGDLWHPRISVRLRRLEEWVSVASAPELAVEGL